VTVAEPWYPCPRVLIGPDQSQTLCSDKGPAVYNLDVTNLTPDADTVNLALEGVDWAGTTLYPAALALAAGEMGMVTVTVPIPMAAAAGEHDAMSVVAAGSVYSGWTDLDTTVALAQLWHNVPDTPQGTRYHGVAYYNGYLYQIGGETGWWAATDAVNRYDVVADAWVTRTGMISGAYGIDAVAIGDYIYVPGGSVSTADPYVGGDFLDMLQIYDPLADSWALGASMPISLAYASAVGHDGLLYVIGGQQGDGAYTNTLYIYDPGTDMWSQGASMSEPRGYAAAGVIGSQIYVAGGAAGGVVSGTNTLEIYDPLTDAWSYGPDLPFNWAPFGDGVKHDRFLIVFDGGSVDPSGGGTTYFCSQNAWAFDTVGNYWFSLPYLNRCLYGSQGDGDGDEFYLVSGRTNEGGTWHMAAEVERLFQCGEEPWRWDKQVCVNGNEVSDIGLPIPVVPSDTVTIVDSVFITVPFPSTYITLTEMWDTSLTLQGWQTSTGYVTDTAGLVWTADAPSRTPLEFTKTFHVEECWWEEDLVTETLEIAGADPQPEPVVLTFQHLFPSLWITSEAESTLVEAGDYATFTLTYGNDGMATAYDVIISNTFPISAPYVWSDPPGTVVMPGSTALLPPGTIAWRVPMLTVGMSDTITVRVMISPTLPPGEEVVIPDSIIWHGAIMDMVETTFQVWLPCEPVTGASFDYTPSEPMVDETITFDAMYAPTNATTSTLTYNWDFGGVLKSGNPVTHTYDAAGTFGITLTVANECTIPPVEYVGQVTVDEGMMYIYLPVVLKNYTGS
jgi:hypothetical protein